MSKRSNDLWRRTCFEAFLSQNLGESYVELNFSPSLEWAAYHFRSYRQGMIDAPIDTPNLAREDADEGFELNVTVDSRRLASSHRYYAVWHLALSAVIEETGGTKSYWALAHPSGAPDFHHPDCFALTLAAPDAA
jgi:hypothetical protein